MTFKKFKALTTNEKEKYLYHVLPYHENDYDFDFDHNYAEQIIISSFLSTKDNNSYSFEIIINDKDYTINADDIVKDYIEDEFVLPIINHTNLI